MFGMVLEKLLISDLQKVSGIVERKITACGITKLLCECPAMYTGIYQKYWPQLLQALVTFFELPLDESTLPDDHFIEIDDTPTFQTASAKLNFANIAKSDPLQGIEEPRQFLARNLGTLGSAQPGKLPALVANINQQAQTILQQYLSKFGVQLV